MEEIFVNIASYAYQPGEGDAEVRCEVADGPMRVTVQFLDSGMPYDPLARGEADISQEALMAREGGLGIHLVKKTMDEVHYVHEDGKNVFTMVKNF